LHPAIGWAYPGSCLTPTAAFYPEGHPMPGTLQEMVEQFCSVLPSRLSSKTLEDYCLELSPSTIQRTTQEILSVSLFWMEQAFRVTLPKEIASHVLDGIYQSVREAWETKYGWHLDEESPFFRVMTQQHAKWEKIIQQGGEPITVLSEAVSSLELKGTIGSEDRQKLLALFLDLVPIEEVGEIAGRIEEELAG